MIKGHDWGEWSIGEVHEYLKPASQVYPKDVDPPIVPIEYEYTAVRSEIQECKRCGKSKNVAARVGQEDTEYDLNGGEVIPAEKVHNSKQLRELVRSSVSNPVFPEDVHDGASESRKAHKKAKRRSVPVEIGECITAGIEDISSHHSGSSDPIVRREGFVIIVKHSPSDVSIGDIITVKITSMNKGDSANAVFISREDK